MATVTDRLVTLLELSGAPSYAAAMGLASKSTGSLAVSTTGLAATQTVATGTTVTLTGALAALQAALLPIILPLLSVAAAGAALTKAFKEFQATQQTATETAIVLKNVGSSLPISELQALSSEIQNLTGFDDDLVVSLGGVLARFRIAGDQIPQTIRNIADAAAATGQPLQELGERIARGLLGNTRGLKELGIAFKATGDRAKDLATINAELERLFGGAGAARRQTLTGALDALQNSIGNFFSALGRFAGPALVRILNDLANGIQFLADQLERLADRLGLPGAAAPAEGIGRGGREQTTLENIERNTGETARKLDPLIRQVLGGRGDVARRAFTYRDVRMSFGV